MPFDVKKSMTYSTEDRPIFLIEIRLYGQKLYIFGPASYYPAYYQMTYSYFSYSLGSSSAGGSGIYSSEFRDCYDTFGLTGTIFGLFLLNFFKFILLNMQFNSGAKLGKFSKIKPLFLQSFCDSLHRMALQKTFIVSSSSLLAIKTFAQFIILVHSYLRSLINSSSANSLACWRIPFRFKTGIL